MAKELTSPARNRRFEEFRLNVISTRQPVSGETRAGWYSDFMNSVETVFAPRKMQFRKPGQPAEMFKARVFLEEEDTERWEEIFGAIEGEWREVFAKTDSEMHTYAGFDKNRLVYEFALLDGDNYLTGSVTVERAPQPEGNLSLSARR
jgi:hypothetical protein